MKTHYKLLYGFIFVAFLPLAASFVVGISVNQDSVEVFQDIGGKVLPDNIALAKISTELYRNINLLNQYTTTRDLEDRQKLEKSLAALKSFKEVHSTHHSSLTENHKDIETPIELISALEENFMLLNEAEHEKQRKLKAEIEYLVNEFNSTVSPSIEGSIVESLEKLEYTSEKFEKIHKFFMVAGAFAVIVFGLLSYLIFGYFRKVIREVEEHHNNLEMLVAERTVELEDINSTLEEEIAERRQVEEKLKHSKNTVENVLNSSIPLCITSTDYEVLQANKAYYDLWPKGVTNGKAQKCYQSRPGTLCHTVTCPLSQVKAGKEEVIVEVRKNDVNMDFIISARPYRNSDGELVGVVESFQDITGWKKTKEEKMELESRLSQAQKMEAIGTLSGGIAHDFNNILSAILGFTELAKLKAKDKKNITGDLDHIQVATNRARDLVKQILTFSREVRHKKQPLQLMLIVKEALKLIRSSIPVTIDIQQHYESKGVVLADPTQIHQVVMNLCTNSYHSMRETGGTLTVELKKVNITKEKIAAGFERDTDWFLQLKISDTGHGIEKKSLSKIFEPYFTTKERGEGTGLGLAVVHGIIQDLNGCITVDSELDKGTTFKIYLPLVELDHEQYSLEQKEDSPQKGTERIMFVDDEEEICIVIEEALSIYGYQVDVYHNGMQAFQDFRKDPSRYDLVISDITMPYMTGKELAHKIQELRPDVPIVLCSGHSELLSRDNALAMGVKDFCDKPISLTNILSTIRKVLDEK